MVDIIDEFPIKGMNLVEINDVIKILKDLRGLYRKKPIKLNTFFSNDKYANTFEQSFNETLIMVKDYIKEAKEF